jgi:cellulose synthase/poly-beta-1,6-N-acetylglucosamine synthase-like glycosyltransferase
MISQLTYYLSLFLFVFVCAGVVIRFVMLSLAVIWIAYEKKLIKYKVEDYPEVSLLMPAFNEADAIVENVTHLINSEYPDLEIIVINDGSKDNTLGVLIEAFDLSENHDIQITESIPTQQVRRVFTSSSIDNLIVVDKDNGGKADALNCGINASTAEYVLALDADTVLTRNTIKYLVRPVMRDSNVIITSGSVRIMPEKKRYPLFSELQKIEFINSISLFRTGWNFMNANLIVSGALGLFSKRIMLEVGGYHNFAIGEDMELIVRIHRYLLEKKDKYKILQLALPTCFTEAVPSAKDMVKQRTRWQKGLLSSLRLNMKLFFNPRYKAVGMLALPFYLFFEIFSPFFEILGLFLYAFLVSYRGDVFSLGIFEGWELDAAGALAPLLIWVAGLVFAIFNDWLSISVDKFLLRGMSWKEYIRLLIFAAIGPFFYHFFQLYCKIKGTIQYFSTIQTSTVWSMRK